MGGKGLTNNYVHTFSYTLRYLDRKDDNLRTFMNPEHKTVCTFWIFILKFKEKKNNSRNSYDTTNINLEDIE